MTFLPDKLPLSAGGGYVSADPGSDPAPEAADLWDALPEGCAPRRCRACQLVFLAGPGCIYHWDLCPERRGLSVRAHGRLTRSVG